MLVLKNGATSLAFVAVAQPNGFVEGVVLAHYEQSNAYVTWRFQYEECNPADCQWGHYFQISEGVRDAYRNAWENFRKRADEYLHFQAEATARQL